MMKKLILILAVSLLTIGCGGEEAEVTFEEQLDIDIQIIDDYLEANSISAEIHPTGIRYVETLAGNGSTPTFGGVAVLKYDFRLLGEENLIGGSEFGESFTLDDNLIGVFFHMAQEMQVGGSLTAYTPSGYAFGKRSSEIIPANSILVFNLELLFVVNSANDQFTADTTIIESYLQANEINALVHPSGIRYTVQSEGIGESPLATDRVIVSYTGTFLDGIIFDQNEGVAFGLDGVIQAWQLMVPTMRPGGVITIYAPSRYCYGPSGNLGIPPNTNLVFEIELIEVEE